jgi:hypothetical protein
VNTRAIRTKPAISACGVCGRNLLRGERVETYISGAERHIVCELCIARATAGGWLREGEVPEYENGGARVDRRRSLLSRLRSRREVQRHEPEPEPENDYGNEDDLGADGALADDAPLTNGHPAPPPPVAARPEPARVPERSRQREPRHVRAVPTSSEHKILAGIEFFNGSEHPRTVAGISRSLGLPQVAVLPGGAQSSVVNVVVAWELCWYRYEMDLSDQVPAVREIAQGSELDELPAEERQANAVADERGNLSAG